MYAHMRMAIIFSITHCPNTFSSQILWILEAASISRQQQHTVSGNTYLSANQPPKSQYSAVEYSIRHSKLLYEHDNEWQESESPTSGISHHRPPPSGQCLYRNKSWRHREIAFCTSDFTNVGSRKDLKLVPRDTKMTTQQSISYSFFCH